MVTGLGVVSAVGVDVGSFGPAIAAGVSGIAPIESVDRSLLSFRNGAEARDFDPSASLDPARLGILDRFSRMALVAAREAVDAAGSGVTSGLGSRGGAVTGATTGGQTTEDEAFLRLYRENRSRLHPLTIPRIMPNAAASALAMEYGLTGPTFTVSTACSSSNHAIGHAFWMIRSGLLDLALAGGGRNAGQRRHGGPRDQERVRPSRRPCRGQRHEIHARPRAGRRRGDRGGGDGARAAGEIGSPDGELYGAGP